MTTEQDLHAAYVAVHDAGEKYQAAYLTSLPTKPALEDGTFVAPEFDQGSLDRMRAEVERLGANYESLAASAGNPNHKRLRWRHYLD
jgi:hypothetical protein